MLTYLDQPIWGCEAIAHVAGLFKANGSIDTRRGYYLIERGVIDATKVRGADGKGGLLVSSRRRVLKSLGIVVGEGDRADERLHASVGSLSMRDAG
jgi:hypothetical protein